MNKKDQVLEATSSKEVRCISTKTIKPAALNNTATQRFDFTPWDLYTLPVDYIQKGLVYLKPEPEQGESTLVNRLKTSLASTLDHFYPLTGRLATETHDDNTTTSVFLDCNFTGAEFVHSIANIRVGELLDPPFTPRVLHSFFPLNGVVNYHGQSQTLLAVQVTELVDGVFIGCTMNHSVCDGTSFWHFINTWSELCRNPNHSPRLPVIQRWFLNYSDCPVRFSSSSQDQFVQKFIPPPYLERFFNFSPENIAKLKAKANAEKNTNKISSLQALLGHVWIGVTRARCLDYNQEVKYMVIVGNRARLNPKLPEEYFGNCLQGVVASAKAGDLLERGLGWAAWLLNQAVAKHNEENVRTYWEDWVKKPLFVSRSRDFGGFNLMTGSSPRFNMFGNDFGWGKPIAVRSGGGNKSDGKITVFEGVVQGGVGVEVCLSPQTLIALGDDQEFMEAVTILPPFGTA